MPTQLHPDQYRGYFLWVDGQFGEYYPTWRVIAGDYNTITCKTRTESTFPTIDDAISAGQQHIDKAIALQQQRQQRVNNHLLSKTSKAGAAVAKDLLFKRRS